MSAIWGHVESVVNQPKSPSSLVLNTRTSLGTRRTECIVGVDINVYGGKYRRVYRFKECWETGDLGGAVCHRIDRQLSQ